MNRFPGIGFAFLAACFLTAAAPGAQWTTVSGGEWFASGDFDGNGVPDSVVVNAEDGTYRIAYGFAGGVLSNTRERAGGVLNVTGVTVGKLLDASRDSLALVSPDANRVHIPDDSNPAAVPIPESFSTAGIGPILCVALEEVAGSSGNEDDLVVVSAWNTPPDTHRIDRVSGGDLTPIGTSQPSGALARGNPVVLASGEPEGLAAIRTGDNEELVVHYFSPGAPSVALEAPLAETNNHFVAGDFSGNAETEFLIFIPADGKLRHATLTRDGPGQFSLAAMNSFQLSVPIQSLTVLPGPPARLLVVRGDGLAVVYDFDGASAPTALQTLSPPPGAPWITGACVLGPGGFHLYAAATEGGRSGVIEPYTFDGEQFVSDGARTLSPSHPLGGRPNVMLYEGEPFVDPSPRLVYTRNVSDWTLDFDADDSLLVTGETDLGIPEGTGNPVLYDAGSPPSNADAGLVNQLHPFLSVFNFSPAVGYVDAYTVLTPDPGLYRGAIQVTLTPHPGNAAVRFRRGLDGDWETYAGPFYIHKDTDLYYYADPVIGDRSRIQRAAYRFTESPDQLDGDHDGVPDYVEIGHGLPPDTGSDHDGDGLTDFEELLLGIDPGNPDSDGDGFSDLEELRAGTDPNDTNSVPTPEMVATGTLERVERHASVDVLLTPLPFHGIQEAPNLAQTNVTVRAYDPTGRYLAFGRTELAFASGVPGPSARLVDIPIPVDQGPPLVLFMTPSHFSMIGDTANNERGRELLGILALDPIAVPDIPYNYGGGNFADEAAAWVAAASSTWSGVERETLKETLGVPETLTALLLERKVEEELIRRGLIDTGDVGGNEFKGITLFPNRTGDIGRTPVSRADLRALHRRGDTGEPAFHLSRTLSTIRTRVNSADAGMPELREVANEFYRMSYLFNNDNPASYPLPVDALRAFLKDGSFVGEYTTSPLLAGDTADTAFTGAVTLLNNLPPRPRISMTLSLSAQDFTGCTVLYDIADTPWSLKDPDGAAYDLAATFTLLSGTEFAVTGFTDVADDCGFSALEVETIALTAIPLASPADSDPNLLPDDWELLMYGTTGVDPQADSDGDGYSDLQEYLEGTDPLNASSFPGAAVQSLEPPELDIGIEPDGSICVEWEWPTSYQSDFEFVVEGTDDLNSDFDVEPVGLSAIDSTLRAVFPANSTGPDRAFYRIGIRLR